MTNQMLVLGGSHNNVPCIQKTDAERPCDKVWFTAKQIEEWSGMTKGTLRNRLIDLEECKRISRGQDFNHVDIPTETGAVKTTIYNLNVLNQLAMVEMKNKVLNETAKKFSDILSEVETTGFYTSLSPRDSLLLKLAYAESPEERIIIHKELYQIEHKTELKRSMTCMSKLGTVTKELVKTKQELSDLKDSVGASETWQSSAQLIKNYPDLFSMYSAQKITRCLKRHGVSWRTSKRPDGSGYPFTIFSVAEALQTVKTMLRTGDWFTL